MRKTLNTKMVKVAYDKGYRVTEDGRVKGLDSNYRKPRINPQGYYVFTVGLQSVGSHPVAVHRLAAYQWFGEQALTEGIEVRHLDGNPLNNSRGNLAIGTHSDNMMDPAAHVRREHALKAARTKRRLTFAQAEELRAKHRAGKTQSELRQEYGLCASTVCDIVNNRLYVLGE